MRGSQQPTFPSAGQAAPGLAETLEHAAAAAGVVSLQLFHFPHLLAMLESSTAPIYSVIRKRFDSSDSALAPRYFHRSLMQRNFIFFTVKSEISIYDDTPQ